MPIKNIGHSSLKRKKCIQKYNKQYIKYCRIRPFKFKPLRSVCLFRPRPTLILICLKGQASLVFTLHFNTNISSLSKKFILKIKNLDFFRQMFFCLRKVVL